MCGLFIDGIVRMVSNPTVANPMYSGDKAVGPATEEEFESQMRQFKKMTILPTNPVAPVRMTATGKANESGKVARGLRDDLVMALLLAGYWQFEYEAGRTSGATTLSRKE